jgi:hypothetical protein
LVNELSFVRKGTSSKKLFKIVERYYYSQRQFVYFSNANLKRIAGFVSKASVSTNQKLVKIIRDNISKFKRMAQSTFARLADSIKFKGDLKDFVRIIEIHEELFEIPLTDANLISRKTELYEERIKMKRKKRTPRVSITPQSKNTPTSHGSPSNKKDKDSHIHHHHHYHYATPSSVASDLFESADTLDSDEDPMGYFANKFNEKLHKTTTPTHWCVKMETTGYRFVFRYQTGAWYKWSCCKSVLDTEETHIELKDITKSRDKERVSFKENVVIKENVIINGDDEPKKSGAASTKPNECCVCFEEKPKVVFMTCKHMICCYDCSKSMRECPTCREPYKLGDILKVYT